MRMIALASAGLLVIGCATEAPLLFRPIDATTGPPIREQAHKAFLTPLCAGAR